MQTDTPTTNRNSLKTKLTAYFGVHGSFCASHPWEVIVTTVGVTACALSVSVLGEQDSLNKSPYLKRTEEKAATFLAIVVNCLAIIYLYNQFTSLRKSGSKYLLSIAVLFVLFASLVFGTGVVNIIDLRATTTGINEAFPFFFVLVDLSRATSLAQYASKARSKEEVRMKIGQGMSLLAPTLTLDTLVETLIFSIGTVSGVRQLEIICCFGCASVLANYVVFMTFFPASLALLLEVCPSSPSGSSIVTDIHEGTDKNKLNPVVQRIKVIMSLGLVVVHLHSRFLAQVTGVGLPFTAHSSSPTTSLAPPDSIDPSVKDPSMDAAAPVLKNMNISTDQLVTIGLAILLLLKYMFYDNSESRSSSLSPETHSSSSSLKFNSGSLKNTQSSPVSTPSETSIDSLKNNNSRCKNSSTVPVAMLQTIPEVDSLDTSAIATRSTSDSFTQTEDNSVSNAGVFIGNPTSDDSSLGSERNKLVTEDGSTSGPVISGPPRPVEECLDIFKSESGPSLLTDEEVISLVKAKHIPSYKLETALGNPQRGVAIRRKMVSELLASKGAIEDLPYTDYNYQRVMGTCCENVIGYMPVPVGVAGPLLLNGKEYHVPMATTEGCLVASTNRGCRALSSCGGVSCHVVGDGMTRGPVLKLPSAARASALKLWLDNNDNLEVLQDVFNSTSDYAHLVSTHTAVAGRLVFIRFRAETGDAMGMNMISKGVEKCLDHLRSMFPDIDIISLSGNYCTDKKPSAINWIEGRGKYVVCDAVVPANIVEKVLKTSVESLLEVNTSKNLIGSAMAGSVGGFNAHASNVVTAIFLATGQDPAQVVGSSNCITILERGGPLNQDLYISCTMPSLEVGTVGGGTTLPAQSSCLKILGVEGSSSNGGSPGDHSTMLARIICGTVLAGELSLLSALAAGHLVRSHMTMNRSRLSLSVETKSELKSSLDRTKSIS